MNRPLSALAVGVLAVTLSIATAGCAADNPAMKSLTTAHAAWDAAAASAALAATVTTGEQGSAPSGASAAATSSDSPAAVAAGKGTAVAAKQAVATTGSQALTAKVNQPALIGDWTLTVVAADKQPLDPKGNAVPAGKAILQIDVTTANNSKTPMKTPASDFQLVDSSGAAMSPAASDPGMGYNEGSGADPVAAGTESMFSMSYIVPASAGNLTFVFNPSSGAKGTLKVAIP